MLYRMGPYVMLSHVIVGGGLRTNRSNSPMNIVFLNKGSGGWVIVLRVHGFRGRTRKWRECLLCVGGLPQQRGHVTCGQCSLVYVPNDAQS